MTARTKQWGIAWVALAPLAFAGKSILRPVAYFLGVLMTLNALAHIGGSIYLGAVAPGALSSPVLLLAAIALLVTTRRAGAPHPKQAAGGDQLP